MLGEEGFRSNNLRNFLQGFPAETLADLGQADLLRVRELQSPFDLAFENLFLLHQLLVLQEEFLIKRTGEGRQHSFPIHRRDLTEPTAWEQSVDRPVNR